MRFLPFQSLRHNIATLRPGRELQQSFLTRIYSFGHIKLDGILLLSHVSDVRQMSTLLVLILTFNAEAASGLANDLAFMTKHLGIILGAGGPGLESLTVIKLSALRLFFFDLHLREEILTGVWSIIHMLNNSPLGSL